MESLSVVPPTVHIYNYYYGIFIRYASYCTYIILLLWNLYPLCLLLYIYITTVMESLSVVPPTVHI